MMEAKQTKNGKHDFFNLLKEKVMESARDKRTGEIVEAEAIWLRDS